MRHRTELVFNIGPGKEGACWRDSRGATADRMALNGRRSASRELVSQSVRKGIGYLIGEKWLATVCMQIHALTPASISIVYPREKEGLKRKTIQFSFSRPDGYAQYMEA